MSDDFFGDLVNWLIWRLDRKIRDERFLSRWGVAIYLLLMLLTMTLVIAYAFDKDFNTFAIGALLATTIALLIGAYRLVGPKPSGGS
jgi:hypothetical protein